MMLIALPLAATGLIMVATPATQRTADPAAAHAGPSAASPLAGRRALDVARIPEDERPRRVTIALRPAPDNKWTMLVDIVQRDGATSHAESTAAPEGIAVRISGSMGGIDTAALRQPGPNTLVVTLGKNGAPVSTRVYTVAKDRQSMTETILWAGSDIPKLETTYFNRIN